MVTAVTVTTPCKTMTLSSVIFVIARDHKCPFAIWKITESLMFVLPPILYIRSDAFHDSF